jgi:hypothetical protein
MLNVLIKINCIVSKILEDETLAAGAAFRFKHSMEGLLDNDSVDVGIYTQYNYIGTLLINVRIYVRVLSTSFLLVLQVMRDSP